MKHEKASYPFRDACPRHLNISVAMGYKLAKDGRLKITKIGRRSVILAEHIDEFLADCQTGGADSDGGAK